MEPRLNELVMAIKGTEVRNQITNNWLMRKWVNAHGLIGTTDDLVHGAQTSQCVGSLDVHGAAATDSFSAGSSEAESWVDCVFDLEKCIQDHGCVICVDLKHLDVRF